MKKILLLLVSIIPFTFLSFNKTYAQEIKYPEVIMKGTYRLGSIYLLQENANTYEFQISYDFENACFESMNENEYFLFNDVGINFRKGINRNTNSYSLIGFSCSTLTTGSSLTLQVTVTKSLATQYGYPDYFALESLFIDDTVVYVRYQTRTTDNPDYLAGFRDGYEAGSEDGFLDGYNQGRNEGYNIGYNLGRSEGYNQGYNIGYDTGRDVGYNEGLKVSQSEAYNKGYNDGSKDSFLVKIDTWLVPAIIIVFIVGIFVTYRRRGE